MVDRVSGAYESKPVRTTNHLPILKSKLIVALPASAGGKQLAYTDLDISEYAKDQII